MRLQCYSLWRKTRRLAAIQPSRQYKHTAMQSVQRRLTYVGQTETSRLASEGLRARKPYFKLDNWMEKADDGQTNPETDGKRGKRNFS